MDQREERAAIARRWIREMLEVAMGDYGNVPTLMFVTLGIVLVVAVVLLLRHRSRHGAHPMRHQRERNIDEIRAGKPPERE